MDGLQRTRHRLSASRDRGEPFDVAWAAALAALEIGASPTGVRSDADFEAEALRATAPSWRAAYLGLPAPPAKRPVTCPEDEPESLPYAPTLLSPELERRALEPKPGPRIGL